MFRLVLLVGVLSGSALAGPDNRAKAAEILQLFRANTLSPNEFANRVAFLGVEEQMTYALTQDLKSGQNAERVLMALSQFAVPNSDVENAMLRTLDARDTAVSRLTIRTLGRMRAVKTRPAIEAKLADERIGIRREAASTLGQFKNRASGPALMKAIGLEKEPEARVDLILALGVVNDPKQTKGLEALLADGSESTRLAATQALCSMNNAKGIAAAQKLMASQQQYERLQGVKLFEGADAASAKNLKDMVNDPSAKVRATAARIMAQAGISGLAEWLVKSSSVASIDDKLIIETEIERLHLTDEQRAALLKKAK